MTLRRLDCSRCFPGLTGAVLVALLVALGSASSARADIILSSAYSWDGDGTGPDLNDLERATLQRVNPATGQRTVIASNDLPEGQPNFYAPFSLEVEDQDHVLALVATTLLTEGPDLGIRDRAVMRFNIRTGARSVVSSGFQMPIDMDVLPDGDFLVLDDSDDSARDPVLYRVDPTTGEKTEVSGPSRGNGPQFRPFQVRGVASKGRYAYVASAEGDYCEAQAVPALTRVDLETGDREVVLTRGDLGPDATGLYRLDVLPDGDLALTSATLIGEYDCSNLSGEDFSSRVVRFDTDSGQVSLISDNSSDPDGPTMFAAIDVSMDKEGQILVTDQGTIDYNLFDFVNERVHRISPDSGQRTLLTGSDGDNRLPRMTYPYGIVDTEVVPKTEDTNDPIITITRPVSGAEYERGATVQTQYECSDAEGPVTRCEGTVASGANLDTASLGEKTFTVTAEDAAGNTATKSVTYRVVDKTDPTVTITRPVADAEVAQGSELRASFECQDESGGSGIESCTGTVADGALISTSTLGEKTFTVTATDQAGNTATKTVTYRVVDKAAPTITINRPSGTYRVFQPVTADYECVDNPGGSGIQSCTGTVADGALISTFLAGTRTFTVTATDQAGNTATKTVTYRVVLFGCLPLIGCV